MVQKIPSDFGLTDGPGLPSMTGFSAHPQRPRDNDTSYRASGPEERGPGRGGGCTKASRPFPPKPGGVVEALDSNQEGGAELNCWSLLWG